MKKDTERNKINPSKVAALDVNRFNASTKFNTTQGGTVGPVMTRDEIYVSNMELTEAVHAVREFGDRIKSRAFYLAKDSLNAKISSKEGLDQIKAAGELSATYLQVSAALSALQDSCTIHREGEYLEYIEAIKSI